MVTPGQLKLGSVIFYQGKPYKVLSIRSVKDTVHKKLYFLELTDEAGERVSLTVVDGGGLEGR